jgi:3HB-oligomer hydrolase (3HBOH)
MRSSARFVACGAAAFSLLIVGIAPASASARCDRLLAQLGSQLANAGCVESADLTTANPATTPADNSLPGLPPFAFTPQTDRAVIAPSAGSRTPITQAVPGVQVQARLAEDPAGEARILIRLPDQWNGKLVVAGASGTRSEFNGDYAWSDYVVQKGYAYVSQNKGIYNLALSTAGDPLACRLNPASTVYVHFYDNDPGVPFTRWTDVMVAATELGQDALERYYGRRPARTYAVGTSNGGYQVRRALEAAPALFDGGIDWEGTFVDPVAPNLLSFLPPAILDYPDYVATGLDPNGTAARNILAAGYPPDLVSGTVSLWGLYSAEFWEVTACQWQKRLDPAYDTYGAGLGNYVYVDRLSASDVGASLAEIATTGRIGRPLITVAGTMDALLPINDQARAYARAVAAHADRSGEHGDEAPAYRLYEVQNGNHIETYKDSLPSLELIEPHAQQAFDLLVGFVEQRTALPPDQCIPRGGSIADPAAQPGHCASLYAP